MHYATIELFRCHLREGDRCARLSLEVGTKHAQLPCCRSFASFFAWTDHSRRFQKRLGREVARKMVVWIWINLLYMQLLYATCFRANCNSAANWEVPSVCSAINGSNRWNETSVEWDDTDGGQQSVLEVQQTTGTVLRAAVIVSRLTTYILIMMWYMSDLAAMAVFRVKKCAALRS